MRELRNALIARLRVGSVLTARNGTRYRVIEPMMQVAPNGSVVPTLALERITSGCSQALLMPVGLLINVLRRGARHKPGAGAAIDWTRVQRRIPAKEGTVLRRRRSEGM